VDVRRGKLWYDRIRIWAFFILLVLTAYHSLKYYTVASSSASRFGLSLLIEALGIGLFILVFLFGVFCCFLAVTVVHAKVEKLEKRKNLILFQIIFYLFLALASISYSFSLAEGIFGARAQLFFSRNIRTIISGFYSSLFVLTILKEVRVALKEVETEYEKRLRLIKRGSDVKKFEKTRPSYKLDNLLDFLFKTSVTQILLIFGYNLLLLYVDESFLVNVGFTISSYAIELIKSWIV